MHSYEIMGHSSVTCRVETEYHSPPDLRAGKRGRGETRRAEGEEGFPDSPGGESIGGIVGVLSGGRKVFAVGSSV